MIFHSWLYFYKKKMFAHFALIEIKVHKFSELEGKASISRSDKKIIKSAKAVVKRQFSVLSWVPQFIIPFMWGTYIYNICLDVFWCLFFADINKWMNKIQNHRNDLLRKMGQLNKVLRFLVLATVCKIAMSRNVTKVIQYYSIKASVNCFIKYFF